MWEAVCIRYVMCVGVVEIGYMMWGCCRQLVSDVRFCRQQVGDVGVVDNR